MSTATIEAPEVTPSTIMFASGDMGIKPKMRFETKKGGDGSESTVLILEDVAVFRSGSFEDSMGRRNTWEESHMESMVSNFTMLSDRNILPNVPVRSGHPGFLMSGTEGTGKVVGWHTELKHETRKSVHDNQEYDYLIAAYEIIDPVAQEAVKSGLWRNRSSEIGTYVTNDGAEYFPVYMGFAYVDIPAVEGLNGFSKAQHIIKEDSMTAHAQAPTPAAPTPPTPPALPKSDESAQHAAPVAPAEHAATTTTHAFRVGGAEVTDYSAVQSHIDTLEAFQSETIAAGRENFVNSLVEGNKILAPAKDSTLAFAKSLTDEQFEAWKSTQEDAPASPILTPAPDPDPSFAQQQPEPDEKKERIEVLTGIVTQHKRANMAHDKIKNTQSYKQLLELDPTYQL